MASPSRTLKSPYWAILALPFGLAVGFANVAVPYILKERGLDMTTIAAVSSIAQLPHAIKFFWAPALDVGIRRRKWFFSMIALTGLFLALTAVLPPDPNVAAGPFTLLTLYTAALFLGNATVSTASSAVLALMATTLSEKDKAKASGWHTAGNLAGTAAGGALVTWLLVHIPLTTAALAIAAVCGACTIPALFVHEPAMEQRGLGKLFTDLLRDVWTNLRSREGWTGLLICLSPVGTGALTNLFSALAQDYAPDPEARERVVVYVTGVLGGLLSALGALCGGYLADRMNRRLAYAVTGGVTALSAIGMMLSPANATAFTIGCLAYSFANGMAYSAFYAFVLEMVGTGQGVTTKLAVYAGASNLAISYVTYLDGRAYDALAKLLPHHPWAGRIGMLGADSVATFLGIGLLALMVTWVRKRNASARVELA